MYSRRDNRIREHLVCRLYPFPPASSNTSFLDRAILHDETTYSDPEKFNPYRFLTSTGELDKSVPIPDIAIFGFGRRICPGRFFGLQVVWLNIANLLATFSFEKRVDDTGRIIEPSGEYTHDLIM